MSEDDIRPFPPQPAEQAEAIEPAADAGQGPAGRRSRAPLIELAHAAGFDLSEPEDEDTKADHARRWTSRSILVATLLLAALNSPSIQTWATTLPPTWGQPDRRRPRRGVDQPPRATRPRSAQDGGPHPLSGLSAVRLARRMAHLARAARAPQGPAGPAIF